MSVKVVKPPQGISNYFLQTASIFLAGSIEMDTAERWQDEVVNAFSKYENLTIYNPRRDEWNASWEQRASNPKFREQVEWELAAMEAADVIAMYFAPGTKSPISLLELGLHAADEYKTLIVCCPDGFWRKGNVEIVCEKYGIPLFHGKQKWIESLLRNKELED